MLNIQLNRHQIKIIMADRLGNAQRDMALKCVESVAWQLAFDRTGDEQQADYAAEAAVGRAIEAWAQRNL